MKGTWLKRLTLARLVAALIVLAIAWVLAAWPFGSVMAHVDHIRGHDEIKTFGYPAEWRDDYAALLRDRYGVDLNPVAGCTPSLSQMQYVDGYNRVSESYLKKKYGRDILKECAEEARENYELAEASTKSDGEAISAATRLSIP